MSNDKVARLFVALGAAVCFLPWFLPSVSVTALLPLLGLRFYASWKRDYLPAKSNAIFLWASLAGVSLEAWREMRMPPIPFDDQLGRPLLGDYNSAWAVLMFFPFIIACAVFAKAIGSVLYKRTQK